MNTRFNEDMVKFVKYNKEIQTVQEQLKKLKDKRDYYQNDIVNYIELNHLEDNTFKIPKLQVSVNYTKTNSYESYSARYLKEQLSQIVSSEKADEIMNILKQNRKKESKVNLKLIKM